MKKNKLTHIRLAIEYLDSFIECESNNYNNCAECELRFDAKDVVDFREARKALELLYEAIQ